MTIQSEFYNYQANPANLQPGNKPNPNASSLLSDYLMDRWGGQFLGSYGERTIREGSSLSTHAYDAAFDWRYENPGPGLAVCDTEIIPWLIGNSKELGVQAIHHYRNSIIWRPPGTSGRPIDGDGWKVQNSSKSGMGQSWALWLHVELLPSAFNDLRSIEDKLESRGTVVLPAPTPPINNPVVTEPILQPGARTMIEVEVTTCRRGSVGAPVKRMQGTLKDLWNQNITVDGNFGPGTETALRNVQSFMGLTVDGICGPKTWDVILTFPL